MPQCFCYVSYTELVAFIATLPDAQLTGTTKNNDLFSYEDSRLHGNSVWISGSLSLGQFIQADLGTVRRVGAVATQGRHSHDRWMTSYNFAYSVDGLTHYFILNSDASKRNFTGNSDRDTVVEHVFESAVAARYVRIYPQTWAGTPALRWEVYGRDNGETPYILCFVFGKSGFMHLSQDCHKTSLCPLMNDQCTQLGILV